MVLKSTANHDAVVHYDSALYRKAAKDPCRKDIASPDTIEHHNPTDHHRTLGPAKNRSMAPDLDVPQIS